MNEKKVPFFARFLERQEDLPEVKTDVKAGKGLATRKYPSDRDEYQTMKYPSDSDEYVDI